MMVVQFLSRLLLLLLLLLLLIPARPHTHTGVVCARAQAPAAPLPPRASGARLLRAILEPPQPPTPALDPFFVLREEDLAAEWSTPPADLALGASTSGAPGRSSTAALSRFEERVLVDVRLVGDFADPALAGAPAALERHLAALARESRDVAVLRKGAYAQDADAESDTERALRVRRRFVFRVQRDDIAHAALASALAAAVSVYTRAARAANSAAAVVAVPLDAVDTAVAEHYDGTGLSTITVYILNVPGLDEHTYVATMGAADAECGSSFWVGAGARRYVVVDLNARAAEFGPAHFGDGLVASGTLPAWANANVFTPDRAGRLMRDVAAFIGRLRDFLLVPSLAWLPPAPAATALGVRIHLVVVWEPTARTVPSVHWPALQAALVSAAPPWLGARLSFRRTDVLARDSRLGAARAFATRATKDSAHAPHTWLDAEELVVWIRRFAMQGGSGHGSAREEEREQDGDEAWARALRAGSSSSSSSDGGDVWEIPIFLFEVSAAADTPVALGGPSGAPAVAEPDLIVALGSPSAQMTAPGLTCDGSAIARNRSDITRAVLGAVLQTLHGVAPTHVRYGAERGEPQIDWAWSGPTARSPFGPFGGGGGGNELSFALVDAAARNHLHAELHRQFFALRALFAHCERFGKALADALTADEFALFVQRWNVFQFKIGAARDFLALHNFAPAFAVVRSLAHDVRALHELVHAAGRGLHRELQCEYTPRRVPRAARSLPAVFFLAVVVASPFALAVFGGLVCWRKLRRQ